MFNFCTNSQKKRKKKKKKIGPSTIDSPLYQVDISQIITRLFQLFQSLCQFVVSLLIQSRIYPGHLYGYIKGNIESFLSFLHQIKYFFSLTRCSRFLLCNFLLLPFLHSHRQIEFFYLLSFSFWNLYLCIRTVKIRK